MPPVPPFIRIVYEIFSNPQYDEICGWSDNGENIMVKDIAKFTSQILPQYFSQSKIESFVRQLNMYSFKKTITTDPGLWCYENEYFKKHSPDILYLIKRKDHRRPKSDTADTREQSVVEDIDEVSRSEKKARTSVVVPKRKTASIKQVHMRSIRVTHLALCDNPTYLYRILVQHTVAASAAQFGQPLEVQEAASLSSSGAVGDGVRGGGTTRKPPPGRQRIDSEDELLSWTSSSIASGDRSHISQPSFAIKRGRGLPMPTAPVSFAADSHPPLLQEQPLSMNMTPHYFPIGPFIEHQPYGISIMQQQPMASQAPQFSTIGLSVQQRQSFSSTVHSQFTGLPAPANFPTLGPPLSFTRTQRGSVLGPPLPAQYNRSPTKFSNQTLSSSTGDPRKQDHILPDQFPDQGLRHNQGIFSHELPFDYSLQSLANIGTRDFNLSSYVDGTNAGASLDRPGNEIEPDRYRKGRFLGCGGYGVVFAGRNKDVSKEPVALKEISIGNKVNPRTGKQQCSMRVVFKEIEVMNKMNELFPGAMHAENICLRIHGWWFSTHTHLNESYETVTIATDLLNGCELDLLRSFETVTEQRSADIMLQLCKSMDLLHCQGFRHFDLKPQNLKFKNADNQVIKILDFGLAEHATPNADGSGFDPIVYHDTKGTPGYRAPEIMLPGENWYTDKVDVWALGCILYQLLSGYPAFKSGANEISGSFPPIRATEIVPRSRVLGHPPAPRPHAMWVPGDWVECKVEGFVYPGRITGMYGDRFYTFASEHHWPRLGNVPFEKRVSRNQISGHPPNPRSQAVWMEGDCILCKYHDKDYFYLAQIEVLHAATNEFTVRYLNAELRWRDVSPEAKDLVENMLMIEPERRFSCKEIVDHAWFKNGGPSNHVPLNGDDETKRELKNMQATRKLKMLTEKNAYRMSNLFEILLDSIPIRLLDPMCSSKQVITNQELLQKLRQEFRERKCLQELSKGLRRMCPQGNVVNTTIDFEQFRSLMSSIDGLQAFATEDVFHCFDVDDADRIDYRDLLLAMRSLGTFSRRDMVGFVFDSIDADGSGCVSEDEWMVALTKLMVDEARPDLAPDSAADGSTEPEEVIVQREDSGRTDSDSADASPTFLIEAFEKIAVVGADGSKMVTRDAFLRWTFSEEGKHALRHTKFSPVFSSMEAGLLGFRQPSELSVYS